MKKCRSRRRTKWWDLMTRIIKILKYFSHAYFYLEYFAKIIRKAVYVIFKLNTRYDSVFDFSNLGLKNYYYPLPANTFYNLPDMRSSTKYYGFLYQEIVKRKILVLDLDETLVHSTLVKSTSERRTDINRQPDYLLWLVVDHHPIRFNVYKRPHLDYFLHIVSRWYTLVVFTASLKDYGSAVVDALDPKNMYIKQRFYRNDCTNATGMFTKNLTKISDDLANICIIDNSPAACYLNPENVIPITSWLGNWHDTELLDIIPFLDALRFVADIRSITCNTKFKKMINPDGTLSSNEYALGF